jgi:hypothetical protein
LGLPPGYFHPKGDAGEVCCAVDLFPFPSLPALRTLRHLVFLSAGVRRMYENQEFVPLFTGPLRALHANVALFD